MIEQFLRRVARRKPVASDEISTLLPGPSPTRGVAPHAWPSDLMPDASASTPNLINTDSAGQYLKAYTRQETSSPASNDGALLALAEGTSAIRGNPTFSDSASSSWTACVQLWRSACERYHVKRQEQAGRPDMAPHFHEFGDTHSTLAKLIWTERQHIHQRLVHIISPHGLLVAVLNPRNRQVLVRRHVDRQELEGLFWRDMPSAASPLEGSSQQAFDVCTVDELMWFHGQFASDAVYLVPETFMQAALTLRRFPYVAPQALEMRHLSLIHILSRDRMPLDRLQREVDDDDVDWLCADLASLCLCGALASQAR
jgi:hypothetical protein